MATESSYYIPKPSHWPLVGSIGIFTMLVGAANWLHGEWYGPYLFVAGIIFLIITIVGWFATVIYENQQGLYNQQVDRSFRWGMGWFIFSEVFFFGAFFGALFFTRYWAVPLLGGEIHPITHEVLWPTFKAIWPLLINPNNQLFVGAHEAMHAWGFAAINTLILLSSSVTVTWAHWGLRLNQRKKLIIGLIITIILGVIFLGLQAIEYHEAYTQFGLTLNAGIYGSTFFMLTGFHGLHVTIGMIMLTVMLVRAIKGHFTPHNHFAFEAASWYWHFVDVVWLFLFIFVYWL